MADMKTFNFFFAFFTILFWKSCAQSTLSNATRPIVSMQLNESSIELLKLKIKWNADRDASELDRFMVFYDKEEIFYYNQSTVTRRYLIEQGMI